MRVGVAAACLAELVLAALMASSIAPLAIGSTAALVFAILCCFKVLSHKNAPAWSCPCARVQEG